MADHSVDTLQCFASLSDSIPCWIARVTELAAHTSRKHAEFSEEFKRLAQHNQQQNQSQQNEQLQQRRRKNSSVHSIRPASFLKAGKTSDAAVSSGEGTDMARPLRPLVIYYDNHTQTELEQTVRDIGAARNSLRKCKMSQMVRKTSLALDMFSSQSGTMQLPMGSYRRTRPSAAAIVAETTADQMKETVAFDFADKQLELAQNLTESAAHQFLRCGDCSKILDDVVGKFNIVLDTAKHEAVRLRAEQKREQEDGQQQPQQQYQNEHQHQQKRQRRTDGSILLVREQMIPSMKRADALEEDDKSPSPGIETIEVDDAASESSISIDITAFRSTRLRV